LPNLDYANAEVRRWTIESASHWIRRLSIDGYRIDVAWGVEQRAPEFWREFRDELMRLRPEHALIAESSARRWKPGSGFDLAYDWTDTPGHAAFEHVFDDPPQIVQRLHDAVMRTPRPERAFRFLNNNDTGERFITRHGEALTRVATAALLPARCAMSLQLRRSRGRVPTVRRPRADPAAREPLAPRLACAPDRAPAFAACAACG
jgi:glycosidase